MHEGEVVIGGDRILGPFSCQEDKGFHLSCM
jgi:hypothetical protein